MALPYLIAFSGRMGTLQAQFPKSGAARPRRFLTLQGRCHLIPSVRKPMHSELAQILSEIKERHYKLVLLVDLNPLERSSLLAQWAKDCSASVTQVGRALSPRLAELTVRARPLEVGTALDELARDFTTEDILFLDGLEVLFDDSLKID